MAAMNFFLMRGLQILNMRPSRQDTRSKSKQYQRLARAAQPRQTENFSQQIEKSKSFPAFSTTHRSTSAARRALHYAKPTIVYEVRAGRALREDWPQICIQGRRCLQNGVGTAGFPVNG